MSLTLDQEIKILKAEVARLSRHNQELLNTRNKLVYAAVNETYARCPGDRNNLSEVKEVRCPDGQYLGLRRGVDMSNAQRYANRIIIQRALLAGGRYWLDAGTYEIDEPITIKAAVNINLAGDPGKTFLKTASGDAVFDVQFPSINRKSVYLHGISLLAEGSGLTHLLKVRYATGVFADGCSGIGETYLHKLFLIQYSTNIQISDSTDLVNCTVARIQNSSVIRIKNLHGRSTQIIPDGEQNADMALVNMEFSDDWEIDGVEVDGYGHCCQWWGADAAGGGGGNASYWLVPSADHQCKNGVIRNVRARNMYWSCVWGSAGENIRVYDCDAFRCGDVGLDSEGGKRVFFINCTAEDCGWRTGGGNFGAFFLNAELEFINCTSRVSNATIIHPEAGINPNIPAGKPLYNHVFHILDYIGYRCEGITYSGTRFITDIGVSQPWMYGDVASLKFINGCYFRNVSLNIGANRGYYREISDFEFEFTQPVPNGIGAIAVSVGDSKAGIGTVKAVAYNTMLPYTLPFILASVPAEGTVPKEPGPGIDNVPGKTVIKNGEIRAKPGIAPEGKNVVGVTTFCYDTTGNQELYIDGLRIYGCNIDVNTKCLVKDLAQAAAPKLFIRNNTFESGKLVRDEPVSGARSLLVWENNRYTSSFEVNLTNALTQVLLVNLTPISSDLYSAVDRYYYLGSTYSMDNAASFSKVSGLVLHYSNNYNNAAEDSYTITTRGGIVKQNHLKGLYALDQRSCTLEIHEGGTDVGSVSTPKKKLLQLWVCLKAGYNACSVELPIGLQLVYENIRPYVPVAAPDGELKYHTLWAKPSSWYPANGRIWTALTEIDPNYANIPDEHFEVIRDPVSKYTNLFSKWADEEQKALLYEPKRLNSSAYASLSPTGAAHMAAGNFDLEINGKFRGFYERYGIRFADFMDLVVADLITKGKIT